MVARGLFWKGLLVIAAVFGSLLVSSGCGGVSKCAEDTDCAKGEICLLQVCLVGCRTSDACPEDRFCVEFQCVAEECKAGVARTCYGGDAQTLGQGLCRGGIQYCTVNGRWSTCSGQFLPQTEICDRLDNDCNGKIDDGISCGCNNPGSKRSCFPGDAALARTGACLEGIQYCEDDNQWGACLGYNLPRAELCDGVDNDCDGNVDEGLSCGCQDGTSRRCYTGPPGSLRAPCKEGTQTCKGSTWGPCQGQVVPAPERCGDGIDNNCDGTVDDADDQGPCGQEPGRESTTDAGEPIPEQPDAPDVPDTPDALQLRCNVDPPPSSCMFVRNALSDKGVVSCVGTAPSCKNGSWEAQCRNVTIDVDMAKESCDGFDNDCDGLIDEGLSCSPDRACAGQRPCVQTLAGFPNYWHSGQAGSNQPYFMHPNGIAVEHIHSTDPIFFVYVSDALRHRIWKVYFNYKTKTSRVSLLAGAGRPGMQDGVGVTAQFNHPHGLALDASGNLYVADTENHCIRKIDKVGTVTTFIGKCGSFGAAQGTLADARFKRPHAIAIDGKVMYIADTGNHLIRVIHNIDAPSVRAFAGKGTPGHADTMPSTSMFRDPSGLAVYHDKGQPQVIVADRGNHAIRRINATQVTTISGSCPASYCQEGFQLSTGASTLYRRPISVAVTAAGDVYVADGGNHAILFLKKQSDSTYNSSVLIGGMPLNSQGRPGSVDAPGTMARLRNPTTIALAGGRLFFSGLGNQRLRSFTTAGNGPISFAGAQNSGVERPSVSVDDARFSYPAGVVSPGAGVALVADAYNKVIRKVEGGRVTVLQNSKTSLPFAFAEPRGMALWGDILYVADKGDHQIKILNLSTNTVVKTIGSGVAGHKNGTDLSTVMFSSPSDVALGKDDVLLIADLGGKRLRVGTRSASSQPISRIATATVTGACAPFWGPTHLAWSASDTTLYVVDKGFDGDGNVTKARVCVLAQTKALEFNSSLFPGALPGKPSAIATNNSGEVYMAFSAPNAVHKYDRAGKLLWSSDSSNTGGYFDGVVRHALFFHPLGLAHGPDGLLVADTGNHRIRVIVEK